MSNNSNINIDQGAMQLVTLHNFKSYEHLLMPNLSPRLNVILGQNGQGKSNLFKAILFALTDKIHLNRNEYHSHLHRALDNQAQPLSVELYLRSNHNSGSDLFKIERRWESEQEEVLKVEEKVLSKSEFEAFVESLGFSFSNSYNILQQGKVNQVTLMDEFEIFKLLEDATSIRRLDRKHQEAVGHMAKNENQKRTIREYLKEMETRLEVYSSRKQEFQQFTLEERVNKMRNKEEYRQLLGQLKHQISNLLQSESRSSDDVNRVKIGIKNILAEIEQVDSAITVNRKQMYQHFDHSFSADDSLHPPQALTQQQRTLGAKAKDLARKKDKLKLQLAKVASETQALEKQLQPHKQKYEYLNSLKAASKQSKKDKAREQLQSEIMKRGEQLREIERELKKVGQLKGELRVESEEGLLREEAKKREELGRISNEAKANRMKYFESNRLKNQYESEMEVFQKQNQVNYSKMRKILPLLQFNLLQQLRQLKVEGVFGFLIQFVEIDPSVLFAYEMSNLTKLCTLLVRDQRAVQKVIEVNRSIKGKQIYVLPLSIVERQPNIKKPKLDKLTDTFSLLNQDWIRVKPHDHGESFTKAIQKIIINSFSSHALVKDYETGLRVSKEYFLNCITAEREIVYSEGYLCKVGKDNNIDDRMESYSKYAEKKQQLEDSSRNYDRVSKTVTKLQTEELQILKNKVIVEAELKQLATAIQHIREQQKLQGRLQDEEQKLEDKRAKCTQEIAAKKKVLENLDQKGSLKVDPKEYGQVKEEYERLLKRYGEKTEEECDLEWRLQEVGKEEEENNVKMQQISEGLSFQEEFNLSYMGGKQFKERLERANADLEKKKRDLEEELRQEQEELMTIQNENYGQLGYLSILEQKVEFYEDKLDELASLEVTKEEIEEHSFSMNGANEGKKIRIFTAFEKLNFAKIQAWHQKYEEQLVKMRELESIEKQITAFIQKFGREKEECIGRIFKEFEQHFARIFEYITGGKTEVRLKKTNERHRGLVRARNSISVMVSFDQHLEVVRKWSQFSGGQKTVIAVCMLMALQKCEPAPMYILDEIDAALDPVYLQKIVRLIELESTHSQYLITSFKQPMTSFPEEICNYYLVDSHNRASSLQRISRKEAQATVDRIVSN